MRSKVILFNITSILVMLSGFISCRDPNGSGAANPFREFVESPFAPLFGRKRLRRILLGNFLLLSLILFSTCPSIIINNTSDNDLNYDESDYIIPIIWKSDVSRPFVSRITSDEEGIYIYNFQKNDFTTVRLNKVDSETGKTVWSTGYFNEVNLYPPIIKGNYIYAFLEDNIILCFDKTDGSMLTQVKIVYNNENMRVTSGYYEYGNYFYFGFGNIITSSDYYLARINIDLFAKSVDSNIQLLEPEIIWQSRFIGRIHSRPIVYNDVVYCNTITFDPGIPVELAGIDINTKKEVFYDSIGGDRDYIYDRGSGRYSLFVKDDILHYLSMSIAAYDIKNYNKLYHILFYNDTPRDKNYGASWFLNATFYKNNIYYTTRASNIFGEKDTRNIFCINAINGSLVWSAIPKISESLGTNPVIYDNKVFIPHMNGVRVYNADTGKLLGVEKRIEGSAGCFNQLFGSIMITVEDSAEYPDGQVIALDLSRGGVITDGKL